MVLPVPGGPCSSTDAAAPPSTRRRSGAPGRSRCACPTTSSSDRGRIRTASGAVAAGAASAGGSGSCRSNRPSVLIAVQPATAGPRLSYGRSSSAASAGVVTAGFSRFRSVA